MVCIFYVSSRASGGYMLSINSIFSFAFPLWFHLILCIPRVHLSELIYQDLVLFLPLLLPTLFGPREDMYFLCTPEILAGFVTLFIFWGLSGGT